ncbi:hypothetical protein [Streptomyces sp. NPDC001155]
MPSRRSYHHGDLRAALLERAEFTLGAWPCSRSAVRLAVLAATGNLTVSAAETQLDDHIRLLLHGTKPR